MRYQEEIVGGYFYLHALYMHLSPISIIWYHRSADVKPVVTS